MIYYKLYYWHNNIFTRHKHCSHTHTHSATEPSYRLFYDLNFIHFDIAKCALAASFHFDGDKNRKKTKMRKENGKSVDRWKMPNGNK